MTRSEWMWIAAVALIFALGYGLIPARSNRNSEDSFHNGAPGKRAYYLLVDALLDDVHRNSDGLIPSDPEADTLVLLGPARYPSRSQWESLKAWVEEGRTLVFAARWRDPAVLMEPFGVEIVPYSPLDMDLESEPEGDDEAQSTEETDDPTAPAHPDEDSTGEDEDEAKEDDDIETELVSGDVDWRSGGFIRSDDPEATVHVSQDGNAQVMVHRVGDGFLVAIASDYLFSNRAQVKQENATLAFRILELGIPIGPVYFDEGLNLAGAPRVVGILFEEPFRALSLQLLTLALLFAWMNARRFGKPTGDARPPRRSLVEHAEALGSIHLRVHSGGRLVRSYLEFFRQDLGVSQELIDATGGFFDTDLSQQDKQLLNQAIRASKSPTLDGARAADLIRRLARLRTHRVTKKE